MRERGDPGALATGWVRGGHEPDIERHTIAVLVDNEPGILARVVGLFSGRGYNIDSLTVAEVDRNNSLSRITVVTSGTRMIIEQIKAQLSRVVPVRKVHDLTDEGPLSSASWRWSRSSAGANTASSRCGSPMCSAPASSIRRPSISSTRSPGRPKSSTPLST